MSLKVGAEAEKIPGYLLWQVSKMWQRTLNAALSDLGLSSTQAVILLNIPRLNQEKRTVTQILLAEVTKIDRMTLSQSVRALERKTLVKRVTAFGNRRAYHVELTQSGTEISMQALQRVISAHEAFFGTLGPHTADYVTLTKKLIHTNNEKHT